MEYFTCGGPGAQGAQLLRAPPPPSVPSSGSRPPSSRKECAAVGSCPECWKGLTLTFALTMRVQWDARLLVTAA